MQRYCPDVVVVDDDGSGDDHPGRERRRPAVGRALQVRALDQVELRLAGLWVGERAADDPCQAVVEIGRNGEQEVGLELERSVKDDDVLVRHHQLVGRRRDDDRIAVGGHDLEALQGLTRPLPFDEVGPGVFRELAGELALLEELTDNLHHAHKPLDDVEGVVDRAQQRG